MNFMKLSLGLLAGIMVQNGFAHQGWGEMSYRHWNDQNLVKDATTDETAANMRDYMKKIPNNLTGLAKEKLGVLRNILVECLYVDLNNRWMKDRLTKGYYSRTYNNDYFQWLKEQVGWALTVDDDKLGHLDEKIKEKVEKVVADVLDNSIDMENFVKDKYLFGVEGEGFIGSLIALCRLSNSTTA